MQPKIKIEDYSYNLPEDRIAKYPLDKRDSSKLLIFNDSNISESVFSNLPELLPSSSFIVFNNTKVVPARLFFKKATGAVIEIFCLNPVLPNEYNLVFSQTKECVWSCVVGNAKRWKNEPVSFLCDEHHQNALALDFKAHIVERCNDGSFKIKFTWETGIPFSNVLDICGRIPIPPYLKRETESIDYERYQTLYAKIKGSVAAPTAGLHFTDDVLNNLKQRNNKIENICLHVGAGTFVPVKSEYIADHKMHLEPFSVSRAFINDLLENIDLRNVVAVGTTSTRCLESLYYIGVHCIEYGEPRGVEQWEPYNNCKEFSVHDSLVAILNYMDRAGKDTLTAQTGIIIVPGYRFKIVDVLITNFHQPQSTLLLLIAALIGEEWRKVYDYALEHGFRFLSYGDSSVLFANNRKI